MHNFLRVALGPTYAGARRTPFSSCRAAVTTFTEALLLLDLGDGMVGLAWRTAFGDVGTKAGRRREGWLHWGQAGGARITEEVIGWWNGDKMVDEETRVIQLLVRRACGG